MTARALQSRAGCEGFTLVELLVALGLIALIAGMTLGSFSFGRRVWEARIERDGAAEADAALSLLRRHLMSALPVVERRPGAPPTIAFVGRSEEIEYVIGEPGHTLPPGLYRVRARSGEPGSGGGEGEAILGIEIERLRGGAGSFPDERGKRRILTEGFKGVRFRYFGAPRPGEAEAWRDAWEAASRLPRLVEITLFPSPGARGAPRSVIPLPTAR